jgi:hypothetical protein
MITFDPRIGTGALLKAALLSELTFRVADAAAERGDDSMADAFWQMGAMVAHA